jgi:ubiquinone/menaquinone biosynthesis C-methylase UbiE
MSEWEKKRDIIRRYDITADIYDLRYEQEQTEKYTAAIESLEEKHLGLVLDVGCGTGLLFGHIKGKAERTVGLDISRKTLLKAKERATASPDIYLIQADADSMPLKASIFDHAFAMTIIQNSPNPVQTLNEIERASKDDAVIVVTGLKRIFSKNDFEDLLRRARLHIAVLKDEDGLKCYVAICSKIHH